MKKRLLLITSILALSVATVSGCGSSSKSAAIPEMPAGAEVSVEEKTFKFDQTLDNGSADLKYAQVAKNDDYEMYIDEDAYSICIKQLSTGQIWNSALIPEMLDVVSDDILPNTLEKYQSPLQITYYNTKRDNAATVTAYLTDFDLSKDGVKTSAIKSEHGVGFRAEYPIDSNGNDKDIKITVKVDYYLTEDGFSVVLPTDAVSEDGDYAITKISVLPNFSSAANTNDGYYMYPDGSGAIMEFKDSAHNGETAVNYTVYGELQNYKNALNEWDEADAEVFIPVFGANVNNDSYVGIIEKGEETASITVAPVSGQKDPFNHLYVVFEYRKSFEDQRYAQSGAGKTVLLFDENILNTERKVSYHLFESGDDTTYADMAVRYREYLIENGVEKAEAKSDNIPVSLDIFMGIKEEGLILDSFKTITTFDQVDEMLQKLSENGVETVEAQLKGWTKNGYYTDPVQFPVNSKVGGASGLKKLTEKYNNDNVKICLETNLLEAKAEEKGYNLNTDTITLGNYTVFSDHDSTMYLLSPNIAHGRLTEMINNEKKYKSSAINGYSFYGLGQYLFYNYNNSHILNQTQCKQIWQDMLDESREHYGTAIAEGGNQYVLGHVDKITDIPYEDSGYRLTTHSVPVYQIAMHGLVEFTGDPGNLSSNLTEEKLKWVEYGYMPYFELTSSGSEALMYTDYNELFSSEFDTWMDEVVEVYKDFNDNLKDVWDSYIVGHEEVDDDVYKVTYENGKVVYVNYTDQEFKTADGDIVEAESYKVIDK